MQDTNAPSDILGIGPPKAFPRFINADGWMVVTAGADPVKRKALGKKLVALSKVEIRVTDIDNLETCIRHLEESDRRFQQVLSTSWNWSAAMFKELTVRFAVEWYDKEFFNTRRGAYLDPKHSAMYKAFGAGLNDVQVEHFATDDDGVVLGSAESGLI